MELTPLEYAFLHLYHEDHANAAVHCATVRYSPLTFRLAEALRDLDLVDLVAVEGVLCHLGRYEEDKGR